MMHICEYCKRFRRFPNNSTLCRKHSYENIEGTYSCKDWENKYDF